MLWIENYFISDPDPTLTLISDPDPTLTVISYPDPDSVSNPDSDCL